jgi:hypothetical protein
VEKTRPVEFLGDPNSQMRPGERLALEGVLSALKPQVAIELGTHRGGSLQRIALHSEVVHAFDLTLQVDPAEYPNVTFHIGDSHRLLPELLAELERDEINVDFCLVDGDHSPAGVTRDVLDILGSPAVGSGVVALHDTSNDAVRVALEGVRWGDYPKVSNIDFDVVAGRQASSALGESWAGLGIVELDATRTGAGAAFVPRPAARKDLWWFARTGKRIARRGAGNALRRIGKHPSQRRAV